MSDAAQDTGALSEMSDGVTAVFIVEAGPDVGLGHLRRAQALAAALRRRGAVPRFLVDGAADSAGPQVTLLGWTRDPELAFTALAGQRPDVVVVDSYRATVEVLERLRAVAGCVVAVDDLADRSLPAHVVVNGALHAPGLPYRGAADTTFLLGPEYALLDPAFGDAADRVPGSVVRQVLVTLGGGAVGAVLDTAVAGVRRALPLAAIDVALGPFSDARVEAQERVTLHRGLRSLRDMMRRADLAVTGGGMTLYECLAAGTPVVGVSLADNQRTNIEALSQAGLILSGVPSLEDAIRRAAADPALRRAMSAAGRRLVDGRGAARVAAEVLRVSVATGLPRDAR